MARNGSVGPKEYDVLTAFEHLSDVHHGDVDVVFPETGPDRSDGAGSVDVVNEQQVTFEGGLQAEIVDPDHAGVFLPENDPATRFSSSEVFT